MAQLGCGSCLIKFALAHFRSISYQAAWTLVQDNRIKRHRQEKPDDPCPIGCVPDCRGHGHCDDCVCGRSEFRYWAMALLARNFADSLFLNSYFQEEAKEVIS